MINKMYDKLALQVTVLFAIELAISSILYYMIDVNLNLASLIIHLGLMTCGIGIGVKIKEIELEENK